jgi:hypothetical protein
VGLVTYEGQKRITRIPIAEIARIYEDTLTWSSTALTAGNNLLSSTTSKKFDLTAVFDLNSTTATEFGFKVANLTITYNVGAQTLLDKELKPDSQNHIAIRLLVDWGQFAVFAQGGLFSFSQQFAFTPEDSSLELFTDGSLELVSMEFHEVARTWGAMDGDVFVADDPEADYTGTWNAVTNDGIYYNQTCHYGNTTGGSIEFQFTGTSISWYGLKNADLGYADVYVDGNLEADNVDTYSSSRHVEKLFSMEGLEPGVHTIRIEVTGEKNANSSNNFIVHDFFVYTNPPEVKAAPFASGRVPGTGHDRSVSLVNLASGRIEFMAHLSGEFLVELFSLTGRKLISDRVRASNSGRHIFSLQENVPDGLYIMKVRAVSALPVR